MVFGPTKTHGSGANQMLGRTAIALLDAWRLVFTRPQGKPTRLALLKRREDRVPSAWRRAPQTAAHDDS